MDDKLKIDFGELGVYILFGVCGRKFIVLVEFVLSCLDYDVFSKGFFILLVVLFVDILEDVLEIFYRG